MEEEKIPQLTLTPNLGEQALTTEKKEETPAPEAGPDMSMLSEAEQKAVRAFAEQIDLTDANQVIQYGAAAQKNIADFSESALEKVKTKDMGELGDMVASLLVRKRRRALRACSRRRRSAPRRCARSTPWRRSTWTAFPASWKSIR